MKVVARVILVAALCGLNLSVCVTLQSTRQALSDAVAQRDEAIRISKDLDDSFKRLHKSYCRTMDAGISLQGLLNKMGPDAYGKFWTPIEVQSRDGNCQ